MTSPLGNTDGPDDGRSDSLDTESKKGATMSETGYELVRVAREVLDELLASETRPVVLLSAVRAPDGTCDLVFRKVQREREGT